MAFNAFPFIAVEPSGAIERVAALQQKAVAGRELGLRGGSGDLGAIRGHGGALLEDLVGPLTAAARAHGVDVHQLVVLVEEHAPRVEHDLIILALSQAVARPEGDVELPEELRARRRGLVRELLREVAAHRHGKALQKRAKVFATFGATVST